MIKKIFIFILFLSIYKLTVAQNIISGIDGQSTYFELSEDIKSTYPKLLIHNSGGSIENLLKLLDDSSSIDMAFLQYDVLLNYQIRNSHIKDDIEIILPMYNEEIHLIAKKNSGINTVNDLQGKTVAIGSISEGTNITAKSILSLLNIKCKTLNISYRDAFAAFLDGKIEAFFYVGGAPIENLSSFPKEIAGIMKLVPVESDKLNEIYDKAIIKKSDYPWLNTDIKTVSVKSYVVHNKNKTNENFNISDFISSVNNNLTTFKSNNSYHPKWKEIDWKQTRLPDWPIHNTLKTIINLKKKKK